MTKIKICGLKTLEDIASVNDLLPDYIGFVFAKSKRQITSGEAAILKQNLDKRIKAVGVFVNAPIEEIVSLCNEGIIDIVQLHGEETETYMRALRTKLPPNIQVILALRVQSEKQILEAEKLNCDYLLLDTFVSNQYGGSGMTFDHSLIPILKKPFFLAGGLKADMIQKVINICHPYCVDVSSSVETNGKKDYRKIKSLIGRVRNNSGRDELYYID